MRDVDSMSDSVMLIMLGSRPQANSIEEYEQEFFNYVRVKWLRLYLGCPMVDMNRRFSLLARQYKISVANMATKLAEHGYLTIERFQGRLIIFPTKEWNAFLSGIPKVEVMLAQQERVCASSLIDVGLKAHVN